MKPKLTIALKIAAVAILLAGAAAPAANAESNHQDGPHGGRHSDNHWKSWHQDYGWGWSSPHVQFYSEGPLFTPWTPGWFAYCRAKYKSFNPSTGYFVGFDGHHHFCN